MAGFLAWAGLTARVYAVIATVSLPRCSLITVQQRLLLMDL